MSRSQLAAIIIVALIGFGYLFARYFGRWMPTPLRPYFERAPMASFFLGISSGSAFAMIGATLTTRLAQDGVQKSSITAFSLAFLVYNFKFLWAPLVDSVRLPFIGRFGQRRSWLWLSATMAAACRRGSNRSSATA